MNSYQCENGERITKSKIDRNIRKAKELKKDQVLQNVGFFFCEDCGGSNNECFIFDMSHTISVKYAQETGRSNLSWDLKNIKIRCRNCHEALDNKTNFEREQIYNEEFGKIKSA